MREVYGLVLLAVETHGNNSLVMFDKVGRQSFLLLTSSGKGRLCEVGSAFSSPVVRVSSWLVTREVMIVVSIDKRNTRIFQQAVAGLHFRSQSLS